MPESDVEKPQLCFRLNCVTQGFSAALERNLCSPGVHDGIDLPDAALSREQDRVDAAMRESVAGEEPVVDPDARQLGIERKASRIAAVSRARTAVKSRVTAYLTP